MKSGITKVVNRKAPHKDSDWCMVHKLDVWDDGTFHGGDMGTEEAEEGVWDWVVKDGEAGKTSRATFWDGLREQVSYPLVAICVSKYSFCTSAFFSSRCQSFIRGEHVWSCSSNVGNEVRLECDSSLK